MQPPIRTALRDACGDRRSGAIRGGSGLRPNSACSRQAAGARGPLGRLRSTLRFRSLAGCISDRSARAPPTPVASLPRQSLDARRGRRLDVTLCAVRSLHLPPNLGETGQGVDPWELSRGQPVRTSFPAVGPPRHSAEGSSRPRDVANQPHIVAPRPYPGVGPIGSIDPSP